MLVACPTSFAGPRASVDVNHLVYNVGQEDWFIDCVQSTCPLLVVVGAPSTVALPSQQVDQPTLHGSFWHSSGTAPYIPSKPSAGMCEKLYSF